MFTKNSRDRGAITENEQWDDTRKRREVGGNEEKKKSDRRLKELEQI